MNRITFAAKIKNGMENEFRKRLGLVWKDVTYYLDDNNISNFSVWKMADLLFVYGEAEDDYCFIEDRTERISDITDKLEDTITWLSGPGQRMQLMYRKDIKGTGQTQSFCDEIERRVLAGIQKTAR